ncbi:Rne/Rng family ribonuclease [Neptunicoccus sediminis]|uniref:Rne/Rng family ribonuclease n=1 Tax=Neptunicoccus sediminis TaxID=1892596 RepID=UPI0008461319|nr:Rne/Rng family ribonuclease [Neptunicoccus sediminis]
MAKKMLIDATHPEETRVVVVDGNKVEEFDFESENKRQLAGNIYLAKVTRVEPSLQAAFVDYGGNRHGFLAFSEIHPDYYQIPVADREKLLAEEAEYAKAMAEEENREKPKRSRRTSRSKKSEAASDGAATTKDEVISSDVIDLDGDDSGLVDVPESGEKAPEAKSQETEATEQTAAEQTETEQTQAEGGETADSEADATTDAAPAESHDDTNADDNSDETAEPVEGQEASDASPIVEPQVEAVESDNATEEVETDDAEAEADDVRAEFRPRKPRARRYKIQEVVKVRQILLVQVVKEERGNKGAALTTYLSLAGRYCVLMPNTARGGGISRKITNATDRKKLKDIANEIEVPEGAGLIIRTAGAKRTKTEIKRDYEYLMRQWEQVRDLTLKSIAPAGIYEEGDLIKRSIRDLYNRDIDEIFVEGEAGYRVAKEYMKMLMPSHASRVRHYAEPLPLFARYQVETYLDGMFNPTVQLKSGGYIVIGITEALVAIDVNSGKSTKEGSIEDTALRTNLEAAEEVARQLKLRDLAGLIVIDFIDMEERRNNSAVEKRMKDRLKNDRARIQVGRISGFGLMEMSRQRLRPGMLEATTQPCAACHGTGLTRSDDSMALLILRELEDEGTRKRTREVLVTAPVAIANYLLNEKREHIAMIEARYGMAVRIEADMHLISPDHKIEKFKTSTRRIAKAPAPTAVTIDSVEPFEVEEEEPTQTAKGNNAPETDVETSDDQPKKKRRRRRRRGGKDRNDAQNGDNGDNGNQNTGQDASDTSDAPAKADDKAGDSAPQQREESKSGGSDAGTPDTPAKKSRTTSRRRSSAKSKDAPEETAATEEAAKSDQSQAPVAEQTAAPTAQESAAKETEAAPETAEEKPAKPARKPRARKPAAAKTEKADKVKADTAAEDTKPAEAAVQTPDPAEPETAAPEDIAAAPAPVAAPEVIDIPITKAPAEAKAENAPEPEAKAEETEAPPAKPKPKRSGWWSRATGK